LQCIGKQLRTATVTEFDPGRSGGPDRRTLFFRIERTARPTAARTVPGPTCSRLEPGPAGGRRDRDAAGATCVQFVFRCNQLPLRVPFGSFSKYPPARGP
jgi:hypothetical protein